MRWAVVGAGSAGCVVAARLSEDPANAVTLFEAGPDLTAEDVTEVLSGPDAVAALETPGRTIEQLVARRVRGGAAVPYRRGRGVGGSSVVNAMVAVHGDDAQYESWGWRDAAEAWQRVEIPAELPRPDELAPLARALLAADPHADTLPLARRHGRRVTSAEAYLWPSRERTNLQVASDAEVVRIELDGTHAVGVAVRDGSGTIRSHDADRVVLCAGAIHSPDLLARSGVATPGLGDHLQDHPSVALTVEFRAGVARAPHELTVAAALDEGRWQVLPVDAASAGDGRYGVLLCAVMRPRGRAGTVRPGVDGPVVDLHLLDDPADRADLHEAVRRALELLGHPAFDAVVDRAYADDQGTPAAALADDAVFDRWLPTAAGGYVHASSSCAMGRVVDDMGRVAGYTGLFVCDASVFPEVPHVHPHLPVTMLAERLVARWSAGPAR